MTIVDRKTPNRNTSCFKTFRATDMNSWLSWDNWKCMNESLEVIRLQTSREKRCSSLIEPDLPRLMTLELESSMDCLYLNIGLLVLNQFNPKLGPGDFYAPPRHVLPPILVLQELSITLNTMHYQIFCSDYWHAELNKQELH